MYIRKTDWNSKACHFFNQYYLIYMYIPCRINTPTHWSSCSMLALQEAFEMGMDYCLRNLPEQLYDGPVCRNGFLEEGEECDCGLPEVK
jgi:hypothetical protein